MNRQVFKLHKDRQAEEQPAAQKSNPIIKRAGPLKPK